MGFDLSAILRRFHRFRSRHTDLALVAGLALCSTSCGLVGTPQTAETAAPVAKTAGNTELRLPESPSGYYGAYTASNVVLFGKFVRADREWLVLTDVHYIRSNMDPEKKQIANQLVKRSREWHQPGESAVARGQILVVEPVAQDSRMMTLIRDMK